MGAEPRRLLMTADTGGGVWNHALQLAAGRGGRGVRVTLAAMGPGPTARQRRDAAGVPGLDLRESSHRLEWMDEPWNDVDEAGRWLLRLEAELQPDVVHLNQFAFGALPFRAPTLVVAHSCVLSWWRAVHGEPAPASWDRYRRAIGLGLAGADLVAAPSRAMLDSLRREHGHAAAGVVVPNGRSSADYAPAAKQPCILSAGRLWDAAKNLSALEAVAADLDWPVLVAGPTASPAGGARATNAVRALGELEPAVLADRLAQASIYALPARYEPFGQSVLEAALSGCALVLGDIASLREIWGPAALYVAPDDHAALRDVLRCLIDDAALRRAQAAKAMARARRFTPERMLDGYLAAYRQLVEGAPARSGGAIGVARQPTETACAS
jgi:glycosyltransferase involved in cell wall biosynthesis